MQKLAHPIKIVFFDIDETLYYKAEQRIPTSIFEQVIPRLKAKGIIPAIATGRTFGAFPKALEPLMNPEGFELFVTTNGQYNLYQGNIISQYPLSTQRIESVVSTLKSLGIAYAFVTPDEIAVSEHHPNIDEAIRPIKEDYLVDPDHHLSHTVIQLLAFYPKSRDQEVLDLQILADDLKVVRWHPYSVDLLNKAHSKARGIQDVLQHFNLSIEHTMAFGDGLNDLEMLASVGFGVAMGNAEPELKAVADYVTLPIQQDGILVALEQLNVI